MSGLELLGVLLGLYPIVVNLAKGYKTTKRSGSNSELHRNLIVASTRFEFTVKGLLESCISYEELQRLAPSGYPIDQTLWKEPVLQQKLCDRIGKEKLDVVLQHLLEITTLLEQVKAELTTLSPPGGPASSWKARVKLTVANMSQSRIQERVKRVRLLNADLRGLLDDRPVMSPYQQAPGTTTSAILGGITRTGVPRATEFFEAIKKSDTCQCTHPHAIGLGCSCTACIQPFSEELDLHSADDWEFCLAFNAPGLDAPAPDAAIVFQSIRDTAIDNTRPTTQDMCSLLADVATPETSVCEVLFDTAKAEDKKLNRMKVCKIGGNGQTKQLPTIRSFNELRRDSGLSTKYRLELAVRLSLAILQLSETPWVSDSWTWNDVCVTKMEVLIPESLRVNKGDSHNQVPETAESSVMFILHRKIYSVIYDIQTASTAPAMVAVPSAVDILDEEPAMTKLGLALIELALGRSIQEMKEEYGFHEKLDNDMANICMGRKLLTNEKIRQEAGRDYERVVDICLKRRFVDSRGVPMSIWSKHDSFLLTFRDNIVRPLYLMWRNH